jgi:hypothetical protein
MMCIVPRLFADLTAKLEDLHAVAIEGQRVDNAHDMQSVLNIHLRSGLASLDGTVRAITEALEGSRP